MPLPDHWSPWFDLNKIFEWAAIVADVLSWVGLLHFFAAFNLFEAKCEKLIELYIANRVWIEKKRGQRNGHPLTPGLAQEGNSPNELVTSAVSAGTAVAAITNTSAAIAGTSVATPTTSTATATIAAHMERLWEEAGTVIGRLQTKVGREEGELRGEREAALHRAALAEEAKAEAALRVLLWAAEKEKEEANLELEREKQGREEDTKGWAVKEAEWRAEEKRLDLRIRDLGARLADWL
ncbi:MAG: hypothetical protein M1840_002397 [Geoglossum simile]|nr:MAG: hypothetical protein M1840_002397 [Geoglossum simile]